MFNYPYDIINNTAQPHGNQKGVSFEPGSNSFVTAKDFHSNAQFLVTF